MNTVIKGMAILALGFCWVGTSVAGSANGTVARIVIQQTGHDSPGVAMFTIAGERNNAPPCSTDSGGRSFALSLGNTAGRAMLGLLSVAQAEGRQVQVHGTHTCSAWGDREAPSFVVFHP